MEWIGVASLTGIVALLFVVYIAKKGDETRPWNT